MGLFKKLFNSKDDTPPKKVYESLSKATAKPGTVKALPPATPVRTVPARLPATVGAQKSAKAQALMAKNPSQLEGPVLVEYMKLAAEEGRINMDSVTMWIRNSLRQDGV